MIHTATLSKMSCMGDAEAISPRSPKLSQISVTSSLPHGIDATNQKIDLPILLCLVAHIHPKTVLLKGKMWTRNVKPQVAAKPREEPKNTKYVLFANLD